MLMESEMGCCCLKEDALFWKNRHIDAMKQLVQVRQENFELKKELDSYMCVKKDLDEKLDKAAADYKALWVESDNLRDTISRMEKTIRDLDEHNGTLRERLANTNESLKRSVQRETNLQSRIDYIDHLRECQAKEIKRLRNIVDTQNGSCSAYTQQGMQSKIAKQANEIKRLTEENEKLRDHNAKMSNMIDKLSDDMSKEEVLYHDLWLEKNSLKKALNQAAKDAEVGFNRGRIKGMEEIWYELKEVLDGRTIGENQKIFGYYTVSDILMNLSPTWFINRAEEYHEQEEKQAKDIQIGDEVEIFDQFDHSLSDIGIVIAIDKDNPCFAVIGPKFEGCFDETDIQAGNVKKTGRHFDSIPLDYFA